MWQNKLTALPPAFKASTSPLVNVEVDMPLMRCPNWRLWNGEQEGGS